MFYSEIKPSPLLTDSVRKYWFLESFIDSEEMHVERILPDGCTELIIHYGNPFKKINDNKEVLQDTAFVFGQLQRFIDLLPSKHIGVMGVRFHPWGLNQFIRIPPAELKGEAVSLKNLFGDSQQKLVDEIFQANTSTQRAGIMDEFLISRYQHKINNEKLSRMIHQIHQHRGSLSVEELTRLSGNSERQLERTFQAGIGLSPKAYSRIIRFQNSLRLATHARNLTDLALNAGYYDQAHFTREFTDIAGQTPRRYFRGENGMNNLLMET